MRREGYDVEVDHVIPLINDYICGLHVPLNLKIVPRLYNAKKSNRTYPGMEYEQRDLLENVVAPPDWDLITQWLAPQQVVTECDAEPAVV